MASRWAVMLRGADRDLEHLQQVLKPPHYPYVEVVEIEGEKLTVIVCEEFANCKKGSEALEMVRPLVHRLSGLIDNNSNLKISNVIVECDGSSPPKKLVVFRITTVGPHEAKPLPVKVEGVQQPSFLQWALKSAPHDLGRAFEYIGAGDWPDLYKAYEALKTYCGGEEALASRSGVDLKTLSQLRRQSNVPRHHKPSDTPDDVFTVKSARKLLYNIAMHFLHRDCR